MSRTKKPNREASLYLKKRGTQLVLSENGNNIRAFMNNLRAVCNIDKSVKLYSIKKLAEDILKNSISEYDNITKAVDKFLEVNFGG